MYAVFLLTTRGWRFSTIVEDQEDAKRLEDQIKDMMLAPMLGPEVLGYHVVELTNQAQS